MFVRKIKKYEAIQWTGKNFEQVRQMAARHKHRTILCDKKLYICSKYVSNFEIMRIEVAKNRFLVFENDFVYNDYDKETFWKSYIKE